MYVINTRADGSGEAGEAMASPLFVSGGIYISESERTLACAAIQSTFLSYGLRLSQAYAHYYAAFPVLINLTVPTHKWNLINVHA